MKIWVLQCPFSGSLATSSWGVVLRLLQLQAEVSA
jgi:hypothetical protein